MTRAEEHRAELHRQIKAAEAAGDRDLARTLLAQVMVSFRAEARVQAVLQDVARVAQVVKRRREQERVQGTCLRMN